VLTTPKQIQQDLADLTARVSICIDQHLEALGKLTGPPRMRLKNIDLLIVDESERLGPSALEYLRDQHDRTNIGRVLIGMPGTATQSSRDPQLHSRVGVAHEYRPLAEVELRAVLERRWHQLRHALDPDDFTDAQALAAIARVTHGNFRLVDRLFTQMERIMKINELHTITDDVVEEARSTQVIGI